MENKLRSQFCVALKAPAMELDLASMHRQREAHQLALRRLPTPAMPTPSAALNSWQPDGNNPKPWHVGINCFKPLDKLQPLTPTLPSI